QYAGSGWGFSCSSIQRRDMKLIERDGSHPGQCAGTTRRHAFPDRPHSMNSASPASVSVFNALPPLMAAELQPRLLASRMVAEWAPIDLDLKLNFSSGVLVLTNQRLLSWEPGGTDAGWREWPLGGVLCLKQGDHAGVGELSVHNTQQRLALWRYTVANSTR